MTQKLDPFHVGIAAEAFAAGVFAQAGCDVLVQYGANQPEYDLVAVRKARSIKISVKGSQDGGWGLIQSFKSGRDYHEAADAWERVQSADTIYCLVQFLGVPLGTLPRLYLATVAEIVAQHKRSRGGVGSTILYEDYTYSRGVAKGVRDSLPASWRLSTQRIEVFLRAPG
ncbi:MAG: hypothetical protein KJZ74_02355 [Gemmatimonadales bacterium]|nr:hypothetical protein [Gemmatimonadales bacterium]